MYEIFIRTILIRAILKGRAFGKSENSNGQAFLRVVVLAFLRRRNPSPEEKYCFYMENKFINNFSIKSCKSCNNVS